MNEQLEIPAMTDRLARYWNQPDKSNILIDENHAVMSQATLSQLAEYSTTNPSGVYPGKMWKRAFYEKAEKFEDRKLAGYKLVWYGPIQEDKDGKFCNAISRPILIV